MPNPLTPFKSLVMSLIISFLSLSTSAQTPDANYISVGGTMLVFIPSREGIVVASDSREILANGSYCDGQDKIFVLRKPPRSLIAMSGSHSVTTAPANADACAFLRSAKAKVDFRDMSKSFLESWQGPITKETVQKLGAVLQEKIEQLLPAYPGLVDESNGGILNFSFVQYLPQRKTITYASFEIASLDKRKTIKRSEFFATIHNDDGELDNAHLAGTTECFQKAISPEGRKLLGPALLRSYDYYVQKRPTVGQVTQEDAISLARDLIDLTIRYSALFPESNCRKTGGPIKIFALDANPHPIKIE
jgi:hypothetical protein